MDAEHNQSRVVALIVLAITAGTLWHVVPNSFLLYDDARYVHQNPVVREWSWDHLRAAFTGTLHGNYHPITIGSHQIDWLLWRDHAAGHHLTSLAFHLGNTLLVFGLARRLGCHVVAAGVAALAFGVHPMHVQSVVWVAERKDVLCTFWFLVALLSHMRWRSSSRRGAYFVCVVAGALALLSKPMAVSLPLVLFTIDCIVYRTRWRHAIVAQVPVAAAAVVTGVVTWHAQAETAMGEVTHFTSNLLSAIHAVGFYLWKLAWPSGLAVHYPRDPAWSCFENRTVASLLIACSLLVCAAVARRRAAPMAWGLLFFFVAVAPVSGIVPIGLAPVADRYTYLPSIGLTVAAGYGLTALASLRVFRTLSARVMSGAVLALVLAGWSLSSMQRCHVWQNDGTLWSDVLDKRPDSGLAHLNLGLYRWRIEKRPLEAAEHFERVAPDDVDGQYKLARLNRAVLRAELHGTDETTAAELEALLGTPPIRDDRFVIPNLIHVYAALARRALAEREFSTAAGYCQAALRLEPDDHPATKRLAVALFRLGQTDRAIEMARGAVELDRSDAGSHANLADMLLATGRRTAAIEVLDRAIPSVRDAAALINRRRAIQAASSAAN